MWMTFFTICDFLCRLIPNRQLRERMRYQRLFDWRRKYDALRRAYPELNFRRTKMIKGGWNIGFIVDGKYVFKIRKTFDNKTALARIMREKRITDAFAAISPLRIPSIEVVHAGEYTFFKYDFIAGKNLNRCSSRTMRKYAQMWGTQLGQFIYAVHTARPDGIDDLRDRDGDGWNHNDICNNVIIDRRTKKIVGLIDWEYSGWGTLETELQNCTRFSRRVYESGIGDVIRAEYARLEQNNK